ncbi:STAS domain-containing protein [Dactylosporangium fulvum]|uniref:STAS domain-containing protein n=1 Tax=Dactylosporangium fulvum TaxID=53359 RepID=A0ABY5VPE5_9ACTN|nr:STAS domain-containing protein [Dactylosporangium fulvum]UWP79623.1 STAS domain-containing protein [Dactylosporangium fulvum]
MPTVEVLVTERLDVAALRHCQAMLAQALDLRPEHLVVDLAACTGIDATGIGMLLDAHRAQLRQGRRLTLRTVPPQVWRMFVLARVDHVFTIEAPDDRTPG